MRIGVVGAGYVGLVAGICLAEMGNSVVIVDSDREKIVKLRSGRLPHYEPGLEELRERNQRNGRLSFSRHIAGAVIDREVVFLAVGSPPDENGGVDLRAVESAATAVAGAMTGYCLVVVKSTVPPGTNRRLERLMRSRTAYDFDLASNPEFLKEGSAVADFMHPDRVIVGARSDRARAVMRQVYNPFFRTGYRLMETDPESAEMIKYASNVMLAARISLMNEFANICEAVGADVELVRVGVGLDRRIGSSFLFPGLGYGGSCFPKDVKALARVAESAGVHPALCMAIDAVNTRQREYFLAALQDEFGRDWTGRSFALLGLAYKPRTDDVRESPALDVARMLLRNGAQVKCFDPEAGATAKRALPGLTIVDSVEAAAERADALFLCTEWNEFRSLDWEKLGGVMKRRVVFDGRNLYSPGEMAERGFDYYSVGRAPLGREASVAF